MTQTTYTGILRAVIPHDAVHAQSISILLLVLQLLIPDFPNLLCLHTTFRIDYPSVLSILLPADKADFSPYPVLI